jgi:hypothetical protein
VKYALAVAMTATLCLFGSVQAVTAQEAPAAFIDVDNDGNWTGGDIPLSNFLGENSIGFNVYQAQPGWKPVTRPVGLVVRSPITLDADFVQQFILTGNIRILASIKVAQPDTFVSFTTMGGDITIAPKVVITGNGDVDFQAFNGGDVTLGEGSIYSTRGSFSTVGFDADGAMTIGPKVQFKLSGNNYNAINVNARDALTIAPGLTSSIPGHGYLDILCSCDITLQKANLKSGYIRLETYSTTRHPEAKRVRISDSTLNQTYGNGDFRIIAAADMRTLRYAPDALIIERSKISHRDKLPFYLPDPIIR